MDRHFKIMGFDKDTKLNIKVMDDEGRDYPDLERKGMSLSETFGSEFKNYLESKGADITKMDWEEMNIAFKGDTMIGYFNYMKEKYG